MTPSAHLAAMYAADWMARDVATPFIEGLIQEMFALGDYEELLNCGFIEEDDDGGGYVRTSTSSAAWVLENWSTFDICHLLVAPSSSSFHDYSDGAVIFPMKIATRDIAFFDCQGRHFDDLAGGTFGMSAAAVSTNDVVEHLKGKVAGIWFMNLTDPAHTTIITPSDTVFVYDRRDIIFSISGKSVGGNYKINELAHH